MNTHHQASILSKAVTPTISSNKKVVTRDSSGLGLHQKDGRVDKKSIERGLAQYMVDKELRKKGLPTQVKSKINQ